MAISIKTYLVEIQGITPYLQHRFGEQNEVSKGTRRIQIQDRDPRVEAESVANRDNDGNLMFPGAAIARLLREAGGSHKQRGSRKSIKFLIPASIIVPDDVIVFLNPEDMSTPLVDFEVDSRPVTIPATKGRIMRHRPRLNAWAARFSIEIDEDELPSDLIQQLLSEGGRKIGIGDFRPEKGGPFGRFLVSKWEQLRDGLDIDAEAEPVKPVRKLKAA